MARPEEIFTEIFTEHRGLLIGVAYRILGSVADAEDVVQEAWLRWSKVDHAGVESPRAFLITIVSRLAIDRLRQVKAQRQAYVGPWLPEPAVLGFAPDRAGPDFGGPDFGGPDFGGPDFGGPEPAGADRPAERAELAESVEMAMLVVLETLSPLERAVFVLREAFDLPFADIAEIIGREEPAARQLAKRAREHVASRRPRFEVDRARRHQVTERFMAAAAHGDLDGLTRMLAADVELVSDGGGKARSPIKVLSGVDHVARFLVAVSTPQAAQLFLDSIGMDRASTLDFAVEEVNGAPAMVLRAHSQVITIVSLVIVDGRIRTIYLVANPEKLRRGIPYANL